MLSSLPKFKKNIENLSIPTLFEPGEVEITAAEWLGKRRKTAASISSIPKGAKGRSLTKKTSEIVEVEADTEKASDDDKDNSGSLEQEKSMVVPSEDLPASEATEASEGNQSGGEEEAEIEVPQKRKRGKGAGGADSGSGGGNVRGRGRGSGSGSGQGSESGRGRGRGSGSGGQSKKQKRK